LQTASRRTASPASRIQPPTNSSALRISSVNDRRTSIPGSSLIAASASMRAIRVRASSATMPTSPHLCLAAQVR
jgi:hypothetical protein